MRKHKTFKSLLIAAIGVSLCVSFATACGGDNNKASVQTDGVFALTLCKGDEGSYYSIIGFADDFTGDKSKLDLPSSYNGKPVTKIADGAFDSCTTLTEAVLPSSITYIGVSAFENCQSFAELVMPASVTYIGEDAFYGCDNLTIYMQSGIDTSEWDDEWNYNSSVVWNYGGTHGVTYDGITWATITEDEVTSVTITGYTGAATELTFPDSVGEIVVTQIADYAFSDSEITAAQLPSSLKVIGEGAFSDSKITAVKLPDGLTKLSKGAFYKCKDLQSVEMPSSLEYIGGYAFTYCYNLTSVIIPANVSFIGQYAFYGKDLTIYAEAAAKPEGWEDGWNSDNTNSPVSVVWGYTA